MIDLPNRVTVLETKVSRIESDIESEKGTRTRTNERIAIDLEKIQMHLSKQDKLLWCGVGAWVIINGVVIPILYAIFKR